jgi:hypothetical protein
MTLRELGFAAADFSALSLPELYLRFCLAYTRVTKEPAHDRSS